MTDFYITVKYKFIIAMIAAFAWLSLSVFISYPWMQSLALQTGSIAAWFIILGVAIIPGFFNAFLISSLLMDKRPCYKESKIRESLPPVTILIAAYNEEKVVSDTINSILAQKYSGKMELIIIDDGSNDATASVVSALIESHPSINDMFTVELLQQYENKGKAAALNKGLAHADHDVIVTIDADCYIFDGSLANLVVNFIDGPANTAAVAGTILVRNSRRNLLTRLQEWDYFHGIAIVKRIQSLFQGTLVAQGALTVYSKKAILNVGGWCETVGEDIVLTWALLNAGHHIGYAENAFAFTSVPDNYKQFFRQRQRWARGLIEAFKRYPKLLYARKTNTPFIIFNALFPYLDFIYLFVFLPGIIAAIFFSNYAVVGLMTLAVLPLAVIINILMFIYQRRVFREYGLNVRRNIIGLLLYTLLYQVLLAPASFTGYLLEFLNKKKTWGTK